MVEFNNFKSYQPPVFFDGVAYIICDEEIDWYDAQKRFKEETMKVCFNSDGVIVSISKNVSMLFPVGLSIVEVNSLPDEFELNKFKYDGRNIIKNEEALIEENKIIKKNRVNEALTDISFLHSKLLLNKINDDEKRKLESLIDYMSDLDSIDINSNNEIIWPEKPQ